MQTAVILLLQPLSEKWFFVVSMILPHSSCWLQYCCMCYLWSRVGNEPGGRQKCCRDQWLLCYGLNENCLHRLTGSITVKRCGLNGVGVALLEKVCDWGQALRFQCLIAGLLLANPDVEISVTSPAPCLAMWHHASYYDNNVSEL